MFHEAIYKGLDIYAKMCWLKPEISSSNSLLDTPAP